MPKVELCPAEEFRACLVDFEVINFLKELTGPEERNFFLPDLFQTFCTQTDSLMIEIESALNLRDRSVVQSVAHGMKSGAANIGASHLAQLYQRMEGDAEEGDFGELMDLFLYSELILESTKVQLIKALGIFKSAGGDFKAG